jgi:hypothetical protein
MSEDTTLGILACFLLVFTRIAITVFLFLMVVVGAIITVGALL